MKFKTWLENKQIDFADPTNLGLKITAAINLVPGKEGTGAYSGTVNISTPNRVGGAVFHTPFQHSVEAAQTALKDLLAKPKSIHVTKSLTSNSNSNELVQIELPALSLSAVKIYNLTPTLAYGGSWKPGVLERMPGYDPQAHQKSGKFFDQLKKITNDFQDKESETVRRKFGDGRPVSGQWLTEKDIRLIPELISIFGDFDLIIKWNQRPRQRVKASELAKNYAAITADSSVKKDDFIREIWVA